MRSTGIKPTDDKMKPFMESKTSEMPDWKNQKTNKLALIAKEGSLFVKEEAYGL